MKQKTKSKRNWKELTTECKRTKNQKNKSVYQNYILEHVLIMELENRRKQKKQ